MEKKQTVMGLMMFGVLLWCVPIFLDGIAGIIVRWISFLPMAAGVITLVGGDKAMNLLSGLGGGSSVSRQMEKKYKKGEITPAEYLKSQQQQIELEKAKVQSQVTKLKQQQQIETEKANLRKLKQMHQPQSAGIGGGKMPDILGNMGDVVRGNKNGPDPLNNIGSMMGSNNPNDDGLRTIVGKKKTKSDDPLSNLQDLF